MKGVNENLSLSHWEIIPDDEYCPQTINDAIYRASVKWDEAAEESGRKKRMYDGIKKRIRKRRKEE